MRGLRLFLVSFLVLFLEVALIRWMPAYIRLLPLIFVGVAALFVTIAQRLGRELAAGTPLGAYTINLLGSLSGVGAFALVSWLELPPVAWFTIAIAAAMPFVQEQPRIRALVS